jgi:hypothetical protein
MIGDTAVPMDVVREKLEGREHLGHGGLLTRANYRHACRTRGWAGYYGVCWIEREGRKFIAYTAMGPGGIRPFTFRTLAEALMHANRPEPPYATVELAID